MKTTTTFPTPTLNFPLLVEHKFTGCIVLMLDTTHGTILQGVTGFPTGAHIVWAYEVTDESHWTILPTGTTVTLTQ